MKRAIWPAGLAVLALVLAAAAPAPDVRAAPPRTVPHGDALGWVTRFRALSAAGRSAMGPEVQRRVRWDELPRRLDRLPRGWPACTGLASVRAVTVLDLDGFAISASGSSGPASPSTAPTTLSSGPTRGRSSGRASIRRGIVLDPGGIPISTGPGVEMYPSSHSTGRITSSPGSPWLRTGRGRRRRARVSVRDRPRPRGYRDRRRATD